jgi:MoxR-like ATPase
LDEQRIEKQEETDPAQRQVRAKYPPIVFITSNAEKDLPDAFLRRCLYFYIEFPKDDALQTIVKGHCKNAPEELIAQAVGVFTRLRNNMGDQARKKVSTSELIDWVKALNRDPIKAMETLKKDEIAAREAVLKSRVDRERYKQLQQNP